MGENASNLVGESQMLRVEIRRCRPFHSLKFLKERQQTAPDGVQCHAKGEWESQPRHPSQGLGKVCQERDTEAKPY